MKGQEELLFADLCSRIPYGVRVKFTEFSSLKDKGLIGINAYDNDIPIVTCRTENGIITMPLRYVKPYLYPLSSMTEEQKMFLRQQNWCIAISTSGTIETTIEGIDWLNKNHFDYRGLIPMGLANDATNLNIY